MHLEDVTIEGFKSFSEPTLMSFQPGIGVIIGNNGVGKSNVLDAIVWALGEDRIGHLRCHEPEELFFAGSATHPPADRILVDLEFRDEAGGDGIHLVRERRRDGSESCRVGDQAVPLPEYRRELARLGLPHALKTIVRQEQINDLLRLPPARRFAWAQEFLEAAGPGEAARLLDERVDLRFREHLAVLNPLVEGRLRAEPPANGGGGLEVEVSLSGGRRRKAHQLSGGERSVASLALQLALFQELESPFYLLDEVEPALDYANHKAMQALLKGLARERQLIMITHLRSTIELADTVHGARARSDGSSFMKFYFVMDERLLHLYKCC